MSSFNNDEKVPVHGQKDNTAFHTELKEHTNNAVDAENREHEMGMWEAAKTYPWACLWAFIMCFTIVSFSDHQEV
jgi:SP family general alpha glucoside:H+ symporter-like MFS transporter